MNAYTEYKWQNYYPKPGASIDPRGKLGQAEALELPRAICIVNGAIDVVFSSFAICIQCMRSYDRCVLITVTYSHMLAVRKAGFDALISVFHKSPRSL